MNTSYSNYEQDNLNFTFYQNPDKMMDPKRNIEFPEELTTINMTNLIAYSILFPLAAIGNLLLLGALCRSRAKKCRVNLMILHLSLADMIVTFMFLPIEIIWQISIQWKFGNLFCKFYKFFSAFGFYMSSMVLVCISLDRYFAVLHPLRVNEAHKRGKMMLLCAWIIAAVISMPQTIIFQVDSHPLDPSFEQCVTFHFLRRRPLVLMSYTLFCICFIYFIPLIIIIFAYSSILFEINRKTKEPNADQVQSYANSKLYLRRSNNIGFIKAKTKTLKMTFIIVVAFILCWTPYASATIWNSIDPSSFMEMNKHVQDLFFILAVSNSVLNPIIYGRFSIPCCQRLFKGGGQTAREQNLLILNKQIGLNSQRLKSIRRNNSMEKSKESIRLARLENQSGGEGVHYVQSFTKERPSPPMGERVSRLPMGDYDHAESTSPKEQERRVTELPRKYNWVCCSFQWDEESKKNSSRFCNDGSPPHSLSLGSLPTKEKITDGMDSLYKEKRKLDSTKTFKVTDDVISLYDVRTNHKRRK